VRSVSVILVFMSDSSRGPGLPEDFVMHGIKARFNPSAARDSFSKLLICR